MSISSNECECNIPDGGFCERHGVEKPPHFVYLCRTNPRYYQAYEEGRGPGQQHAATPILPPSKKARKKGGCGKRKSKGLGDRVGQALSVVGITDERVSKWLGRPCNCPERRRKLNALGDWVLRTVGMSKEEAAEELEKILE